MARLGSCAIRGPDRVLTEAEVTRVGVAQFGLAPPPTGIVVSGPDTSVFAISFGAANPMGLSHYARMDGSAGDRPAAGLVAEEWERTGGTPTTRLMRWARPWLALIGFGNALAHVTTTGHGIEFAGGWREGVLSVALLEAAGRIGGYPDRRGQRTPHSSGNDGRPGAQERHG